MKKFLSFLFVPLLAFAQTNIQKDVNKQISNGSVVVGNNTSLTATGTGVIAATSIPGLTISTTAPLTGGGSLAGNLTLAIPAATGSVNGFLTAADWTTFNAKAPAGNYLTALIGDGTAAGPGAAVFTLATVNTNVGTFAGIAINGKGLVTGATALTTLAGYGITDGVNTVSNDTNVTGSASGHTLTLGWAGTLAAGRLNANVVQGVTNDLNVTGSIATQALTLGWTGTLAAGRLNSNVVQSVNNDTNVIGSIATQALTLGWTGQLSVARGGTGVGTLTGVVLGNGTSAFTAATLSNLTLSSGTLSISATYPGQSSIVTVGTLTSGAIGAGFTAIPNSALANSSVTIGSTSIALGGTSTTLAGLTSIAGPATITGGASNMTIIAGTGNSRTMVLQTTTSGGVATTFLTGNSDQSAAFAGVLTVNSTIDATTGGSGYSLGSLGGIYAAKKIVSASAVFDGNAASITGINSITAASATNLVLNGGATSGNVVINTNGSTLAATFSGANTALAGNLTIGNGPVLSAPASTVLGIAANYITLTATRTYKLGQPVDGSHFTIYDVTGSLDLAHWDTVGNLVNAGNLTVSGTGNQNFSGAFVQTLSTGKVSGQVTVGAAGAWQWGPNVGSTGTDDTYGFYSATHGPTPVLQLFNTGAATLAGNLTVSGTTGIAIGTAGATLSVKSGANAASGTVTLVAGTATITSTAIDANTVIIFSEKTAGGTPGVYQPLAAVSAGSATVTSAATDTSTYNWVEFKVN